MIVRPQSSKALRHSRNVCALAVLVAGAAACSLAAPSYGDYAQVRPGSGGSGASESGGSSGDTGAAGGIPGTSGSSSGGTSMGASAGTSSGGSGGTSELGTAGAAGSTEVVPPAVQGEVVAASEAQLRAVNSFHTPIFAPLTHYAVDESIATLPGRPAPSYQPYDSSTTGFWDNLVAEQLQARIATVLLPSRGVYQLSSTDLTGPSNGGENPRRLSAWLAAVARAGVPDQFQAACRLEVASLQDVAGNFHGTGGTPVLDLSVQSDWNDIFWLRGIKPWFDTIPSSYWSSPVINVSGVSASVVSNAQGNASKLLSFIAAQFLAAYGSAPQILVDSSWFSLDTTLASDADVSGNCPNFSVPGTPFAYTGDCGTVLPGYINPSYFDSTSASYMSASVTVPRSTVDPYSNTVFTLETGLSSAATHGSPFTVLYSYTDINESAGFYRSAAWDYPNRYLNLIRRYSDPPTRTVQLQAENCDKYFDTTSGNSGNVFSRSGDLDIRALSAGGWAVTNTAAGEWIEFDNLDFSAGNYEVLARYSETSGTPAGGSDILSLRVDGQPLAPVMLPSSPNVDSFVVTSLGSMFFGYGPHTLRVGFDTGLVDLDWLFVKKLDPTFALKVSSGNYLSADGGGGSDLDSNATEVGVWEELMFVDLNGGKLVDGDTINLMTYDGFYLTSSGGKASADKSAPGATEVFTVKLVSGSSIKAGSSIALLASDGTHYVTFVSGKSADASGTTIGAAQTFVLADDDQ